MKNCAGATGGEVVTVKIKISYQEQEELNKVVKCLQPLGIELKIAKRQNSQFKNAYINLKKIPEIK